MSILIEQSWGLFLLAAGLAGFAWLCFSKFDVALCLAIFLAPLYLLKIRIFFIPFSALELMVWLAFSAWIIGKGYREMKLPEIFMFAVPALLVLIGAAVSAVFSENIEASAGILKSWFLAPLIFSALVYSQAKRNSFHLRFLYSFVFSAGAVSLAALCFFLAGQMTYDGRLAGFFLSPNHLAMYLAPGFLAGVAILGSSALRPRGRIFEPFVFSVVFSGLALYLTFSYSAWLGVAAAALAWLFFSSGHRVKIAIFLSLIFLVFFSQIGSDKLGDLFCSPNSSWQSRLMIWRAAWEMGKDNFLIGIGPGMFQEYYLAYQSRFPVPYLEWAVPQPHNLFLAFWLQAGILGLAGFLWLLFSFFGSVFAKRKNQLALVLFLPMVSILVHGLADTPYFKNDLALIFWALMGLAAGSSFWHGDAPEKSVSSVRK